MLIRLGIHYASEEALTLAEEVMSFITGEAVKVSMELAGVPALSPNGKDLSGGERGIKVRNATLTTIAPTGTLVDHSEGQRRHRACL